MTQRDLRIGQHVYVHVNSFVLLKSVIMGVGREIDVALELLIESHGHSGIDLVSQRSRVLVDDDHGDGNIQTVLFLNLQVLHIWQYFLEILRQNVVHILEYPLQFL